MESVNLNAKLEYLGLNLNSIPDFLKNSCSIDLSLTSQQDEKNYKVYKYIKIKDIKFMLTPGNRLMDSFPKYSKAAPLSFYFKRENLEEYAKILQIIEKTSKEEIENLIRQQINLNKKIPLKIKFNKDYLWQMHYDQNTNQYFMLVPTEETEFAAFLYLLKKQLENSKEEIFVPICNINYSNNYLSIEEIDNLENYLYFFTKEWPNIYEVYDKENNCSLEILGSTDIFKNIKSEYKIKIQNKKDALEQYKLIKALFLLQSELQYYFKFDINIKEDGNFYFTYNGKSIEYTNLVNFINEQYRLAVERLNNAEKEELELKTIWEKLKEDEKNLNNEFLQKQKQITTFLEYRKTFVGRVKYFFKYSKKKKELEIVKKYNENKENNNILKSELSDEIPTIDTLINICKTVISKEKIVKLKILDCDKINAKIKIIKKKIENANLYIAEIDKHKKSIFDFWKFTSKDEANKLTEGIENTIKENKIRKDFDFNTDFPDLAKILDSKQREALSRDEINSIFITTTDILQDINKIINGKSIEVENLNKLKQELKEHQKNGFDILEESDTENKNLKHRETKRNKFNILKIDENTSVEEYTTNLNKIIKELDKAFSKANLEIDIPVYMAGDEKIKDILQVFSISPENLIKNAEGSLTLHIINLKKDTRVLAFSNIVFYNNTNETLPLGMNVKRDILINMKDLRLNLKSEKVNNVLVFDDNIHKIKILKIKILEYDL